MDNPKVVVIGAGAMGGSLAGALRLGGADVTILDTDCDHVDAINADGLRVDGLAEIPRIVAVDVPGQEGAYDLALIMTPAYETEAAAQAARQLLKLDGSAISCQNGLGNMELLVEALGRERVFMGSTKASADRPAPGRPRITRMDPTTVGELDGQARPRTEWFRATLEAGGMPCVITDNIEGALWTKFIHNCCINALSAITGLRMGHVTRIRALGELRWKIVDEALAVARAKGIKLLDPNPRATLEPHVWRKFTQPSMLQHIEQRRMIEIDAINGYLSRTGDEVGIETPVNDIVFAMACGRGMAVILDREDPDYAALSAKAEAEIERGERPWEDLP